MDCSGGNGTCQCDICQEEYEAAWDRKVAVENLCRTCGVPKVLTMESIFDTQYTHFFMPCPECRDKLDDFLAEAGICILCRGKIQDGACPRCDAKNDSDSSQ
jgi:hypothetical protein